MCKARPSWWNSRRPAGFRLWTTDVVVLGLCAPAACVLWPWIGEASLLLPVVLAHFFLFCNVFRVRRAAELIWAGALVVNGVAWMWFDAFAVWRLALAQSPLTVAVILSAVLSKEYRGICSRKLKEEA